jgi:hypothetical protein
VKTSKYALSAVLTLLVILSGLVSGCVTQTDAELGKLIFQDDFKDSKSGWFIYKADDTKGGGYEPGDYRVWAATKATVVVLNPKTRQQLSDFAAEVDVRKTSSQQGAIMSIIYRLNDNGNYYRFAITDNRTFYVGRSDGQFEEEIEPMTSSEFIKPGNEYNRLKVVCKGSTQDVYVNGNKLATLSDNTSLKGELGIAFSNWAPSENYTFTNFKLYSLK